jgi:hypothetical protein
MILPRQAIEVFSPRHHSPSRPLLTTTPLSSRSREVHSRGRRRRRRSRRQDDERGEGPFGSPLSLEGGTAEEESPHSLLLFFPWWWLRHDSPPPLALFPLLLALPPSSSVDSSAREGQRVREREGEAVLRLGTVARERRGSGESSKEHVCLSDPKSFLSPFLFQNFFESFNFSNSSCLQQIQLLPELFKYVQ